MIWLKKVNSWHESSKCTITQTDISNNSNNNNNNSDEQDDLNLTTTAAVTAIAGARNSENEENVLKINCHNNNLIFIAWSHYGQHQSQTKSSNQTEEK